MGKSRRRTPIVGRAVADSDKPSKIIGHRQERAATRDALRTESEVPHRHQFGDPWKSEKDGKLWIGDRHPELMRK